jgi:hypothetical protein
MFTINSKTYKICYLDTCVLSEIIKNKQKEFNNILKRHSPDDSIIGISISTLFELRQHQKLYESFIKIFSIIPLVFIKSYNQIFQEEINNYPNYKNINPILHAVSPSSINKFGKLNELLKHIFSKQEILDIEHKWNTEKRSIFDNILKLKNNFPPKKDRYSSTEAIEFVREATFQQIILQAPEFIQNFIKRKKIVDVDAFPSLKIQLYNVFYRFYDGNRKPEIQDVFDILISSSIPYIEFFYTERFQAEIIKKVNNRDTFINNVKTYTMRELRN